MSKAMTGVVVAAWAMACGGAAAQPPGAPPFDPHSLNPPEVQFDTAPDGDREPTRDLTKGQESYVPPATAPKARTTAADLMMYLTVFALSVFVGFEVISKVPPTLHTPLMSGSNAISGITLIGAIVTGGENYPILTIGLAFLAVVFATINVVGGFLVTHRMLGMFRRKT